MKAIDKAEKRRLGIYLQARGYEPKRDFFDPDNHECFTCHMSVSAHRKLPDLTCEDFK